jgi:hypothetical protein
MGVGASSGVRFGLAELARIGPRSVVDGSRLGCRHGEEQVAVESERGDVLGRSDGDFGRELDPRFPVRRRAWTGTPAGAI